MSAWNGILKEIDAVGRVKKLDKGEFSIMQDFTYWQAYKEIV